MLRYFTSGETHGKCLTAIVEGMPSGVKIDIEKINNSLARRQKGYGRGGRMLIEKDRAEILSGVRGGYTLGSPIAIKIENKDWKNWEAIMGTEASNGQRAVTCPRPGHADLSGGMKYNHKDLRNVLERASARETAARVAVGALVSQLTDCFGIEYHTHVVNIGNVYDNITVMDKAFFERVKNSSVGFGDEERTKEAERYIDSIKAAGESCGGVVETIVTGVPAGLGSYVHYDRKLDAALAFAVMSVQAIKGVELGLGFECAQRKGSDVHDSIYYNSEFFRATNNAGGIEGGMSNGEPIIIRGAMKPIPTLYTPLDTVRLEDKSPQKASVERSDTCAVLACSVVVESVVAFEIARAFVDKFSGDCIQDIQQSYRAYTDRIKSF